MRQFIRHPLDIPIQYSLINTGKDERNVLNNISQGGLCFRANSDIEIGRTIRINIVIHESTFEATGIIVWCRRINGHYDVGVKFEDANTEFSVRMIEQVCHINHYRKEILEKEGRTLSGQEAAAEWVEKFSRDFPQ